MATTLHINGVNRTPYLKDGSLGTSARVGSRSVLRMTLVDREALYRPIVRQSVFVTRDEQTGVGSMTGGAPTLKTVTVPTANFTSADIGKAIMIPAAGPDGATLHATIMSTPSSTQAVTNRFAYQSVAGVIVRWGWRHFGGIIQAVGESAMVDDVGLVTPVTAADFGSVLDRRVMNEFYFADFLDLKSTLDDIGFKYLDSNGVFIDTEMDAGPLLPELNFEYVPVRDAFNKLSEITGRIVWTDYTGVVYMAEAATRPTPVTLNAGNATVRLGSQGERESGQYRNRQYVRYGSGTKEVTELLQGDGVRRTWILEQNPQERPSQVYDNQASAWRNVGVAGTDTLFEWVYDRDTNTIEQLAEAPPGDAHAPLGLGQSVSIVYVGVFPNTVSQANALEIATYGNYDHVHVEPDVFDQGAAMSIAGGLLRRYGDVPQRLDITTFEHRFAPGQYGEITSTVPAASGDYLIEEVRADLMPSDPERWVYQLSAIEGTDPQGTWLDWFRSLSGGSSSGSGAISVGGTPPPPPPTGGGSGGGAWIAFLGGADPDRSWIAPSAGTWFDAPHHVDLSINGDLAGTVAAVRVHLLVSNAAMSITPRLLNTSAGTVAGTGTPMNATSYTYQSFYVTLASGIQVYRLQFNCSSIAHEYGYWQATSDNQG